MPPLYLFQGPPSRPSPERSSHRSRAFPPTPHCHRHNHRGRGCGRGTPLPTTTVAAAATASNPPPPTGIFLKDVHRTDMAAYERAIALLQLGRLQRLTAAQLIEGIQIDISDGKTLTLKFLTVVPFFNVIETYSLSNIAPATSTQNKRRDLRPGLQQCTARLDDDGTTMHIYMTWEAPNAGSMEECIALLADGTTLEYHSTVTVAAGSETTKSVYTRADAWKPRYQWNPIKALQIMAKNQSEE